MNLRLGRPGRRERRPYEGFRRDKARLIRQQGIDSGVFFTGVLSSAHNPQIGTLEGAYFFISTRRSLPMVKVSLTSLSVMVGITGTPNTAPLATT